MIDEIIEIALPPDVPDDEWDYEICSICGSSTTGEKCHYCGEPLCPTCYESGHGFCSGLCDHNFHKLPVLVKHEDLEAVEAKLHAVEAELAAALTKIEDLKKALEFAQEKYHRLIGSLEKTKIQKLLDQIR